MSDEKVCLMDGFDEWLKAQPADHWKSLEKDYIYCSPELAAMHLGHLLRNVWVVARGREVARIDEMQRKIKELKSELNSMQAMYERAIEQRNVASSRREKLQVEVNTLNRAVAYWKGEYDKRDAENNKLQGMVNKLQNERRGLSNLPSEGIGAAGAQLQGGVRDTPSQQYIPDHPGLVVDKEAAFKDMQSKRAEAVSEASKPWLPDGVKGDHLLFWMATVTGALRIIAPAQWEEARKYFIAVKEDWAKGK